MGENTNRKLWHGKNEKYQLQHDMGMITLASVLKIKNELIGEDSRMISALFLISG